MARIDNIANHALVSEKAIERYLVEEVARRGGICLKYDNPHAVGFPDRLVILPGHPLAWVEVKSRGAYLMGLTTYGNYAIEDTVDFNVYVPKTDKHFAPSLAVIPLQLLGYYIAMARGLDVDKPRNLAKSVTVE
jgi:glucosamine--fructose-6-phosphate aminotransferase (isomerizing)